MQQHPVLLLFDPGGDLERLEDDRPGLCGGELGFNPRPPRRAGATGRPGPCGYSVRCVSILARPGGRALRGRINISRFDHASFNPRPPRRAGATNDGYSAAARSGRFNPRPPRRAGATACTAIQRIRCDVSILARPGGRALHLSAFKTPVANVFQSSPAPEGGRYPACGRFLAHRERVSILARPGGRALPELPHAVKHPAQVSILARPGGRALRCFYQYVRRI